jgi:hypothetical protein
MSRPFKLLPICLLAWVIGAPVLWWNYVRVKFGVELPLQILWQHGALMLMAACSSAVVLRRRHLPMPLAAPIIVVAASAFVFPSQMVGGLILNTVLFCLAIWLTGSSSGQPSAAAQH